MSWLDKYFNTGIVNLQQNGVPLPQQRTLDVVGASLVDQPDLQRTLMTIDEPPTPRTPFGPNAFLVQPPALSTFTQINPSPNWITQPCAATIQEHPSGYGIAVYGTQSSAHACFSGIFMPRGSFTELIVQVASPYWGGGFINTNTNVFGGIMAYDSASGKSTFMGPYVPPLGSNESPQMVAFRQNVPGDTTAAVANFAQAGAPLFPMWYRWTDDGTNYNFQFSADGNWTTAPVYSEGRTAWLPSGGDYVGIAAGGILNSGTRENDRCFSLWLGSWLLR